MRAVQVLLAEDNNGDLKLFEEYLKISRIILDLHIVKKTEEIHNFLSREHSDILMINLDLPIAELKNLISEIKALKPELPVIIITKSYDESEILKDNEVMADYYLNGPGDGYEIIRAITEAGKFFIHIVKTN